MTTIDKQRTQSIYLGTLYFFFVVLLLITVEGLYNSDSDSTEKIKKEKYIIVNSVPKIKLLACGPDNCEVTYRDLKNEMENGHYTISFTDDACKECHMAESFTKGPLLVTPDSLKDGVKSKEDRETCVNRNLHMSAEEIINACNKTDANLPDPNVNLKSYYKETVIEIDGRKRLRVKECISGICSVTYDTISCATIDGITPIGCEQH